MPINPDCSLNCPHGNMFFVYPCQFHSFQSTAEKMARSVRSKRKRANNAIKREKLKKHEARHLNSILERLKTELGVEENMITGLYRVHTISTHTTEPIAVPQEKKATVKITVEGEKKN